MRKHLSFIANDDNDLKPLDEVASQLETKLPFEFLKGQTDDELMHSELAVKVAVVTLSFLIALFAGFLIYLVIA